MAGQTIEMGECPPIFLLLTKVFIIFRKKFCLLAIQARRLIDIGETRVQAALRRIGRMHDFLGGGEGGRLSP